MCNIKWSICWFLNAAPIPGEGLISDLPRWNRANTPFSNISLLNQYFRLKHPFLYLTTKKKYLRPEQPLLNHLYQKWKRAKSTIFIIFSAKKYYENLKHIWIYNMKIVYIAHILKPPWNALDLLILLLLTLLKIASYMLKWFGHLYVII